MEGGEGEKSSEKPRASGESPFARRRGFGARRYVPPAMTEEEREREMEERAASLQEMLVKAFSEEERELRVEEARHLVHEASCLWKHWRERPEKAKMRGLLTCTEDAGRAWWGRLVHVLVASILEEEGPLSLGAGGTLRDVGVVMEWLRGECASFWGLWEDLGDVRSRISLLHEEWLNVNTRKEHQAALETADRFLCLSKALFEEDSPVALQAAEDRDISLAEERDAELLAEAGESISYGSPLLALRPLRAYISSRGVRLGEGEEGVVDARGLLAWCIFQVKARSQALAEVWEFDTLADAAELARRCTKEYNELACDSAAQHKKELTWKELRCRRLFVHCLLEDGRLEEAERAGEESERAHEEALVPVDRSTLRARHLRDLVLFHLGRHREAAERARETFDRQRERLGERDRHTLESMVLLVGALASSTGEEKEGAVELGRRCWQLCCWVPLSWWRPLPMLAWRRYTEALLAHGDVAGAITTAARLELHSVDFRAWLDGLDTVGAFRVLAEILAVAQGRPIPVVTGAKPPFIHSDEREWDPFVRAVMALLHSWRKRADSEVDLLPLEVAEQAVQEARERGVRDRHLVLPFALAVQYEVLCRLGLFAEAQPLASEALELMPQGHWYEWRLRELVEQPDEGPTDRARQARAMLELRRQGGEV